MENLSLYGVMAIPLVTGIVEMLTSMGFSKRFAPLISLIVGVAVGVIGFSDGSTLKGIVVGCAIGLSASGFYSAVKMPFKEED